MYVTLKGCETVRVQEMIFFLEEMEKTAEKIKDFDHDKYGGYNYDEHDLITKYIDDSMQEVLRLRIALSKILELRQKVEFIDEFEEARMYNIAEKIAKRALGF